MDSKASFGWRSAVWSLQIPMVRELFEQIATPTRLGPLGISDILDWTESALKRVDRNIFFKKFEEHHAVQYFYEPFLEAFDPELRKALGVWYTPPEVVEYMIDRVDTVLKQELNLPDGLADQRVFILDPGCGTGSFLVEVLRKIARTLKENGGDALVANDLKRAAMERVLGFEILPAPYVVAHLQIGLLLHSFGSELSQVTNERVSVYLTNSLTGWYNPDEPQKRLIFPELEQEREAAAHVKRETPILVILGNPPYNTFAGVSTEEEQGSVEPYKEGLIAKWRIKKFNLDDLYVRFFRLAERRIVERSGRGIICYISNFSFLSQPSFVVMRKRFLDEFDKMWFDCMNGSSRETGKRTPDGKPDPSVFSTEKNPEGIRVGTVITLLVKKSVRQDTPIIRYRNFWGENKREDLLRALDGERFDESYNIVNPEQRSFYSFRSGQSPSHYLSWPAVPELCKERPSHGPSEMRGNSLIKLEADKKELEIIKDYLDPLKSHEQIRVLAPRLMKSSGEFKGEEARDLLKGKIKYDPMKIVRYSIKPLDVRVAYLDSEIQPLFSRPSPKLLKLSTIPNNSFIITRDTADKTPEGSPFYYSSLVCDYHCISGEARHFPLWIHTNDQVNRKLRETFETDIQVALSGDQTTSISNLSAKARGYLKELGITAADLDQQGAKILLLHALAIGYSPAYLLENVNGIRSGWPAYPIAYIKTAIDGVCPTRT